MPPHAIEVPDLSISTMGAFQEYLPEKILPEQIVSENEEEAAGPAEEQPQTLRPPNFRRSTEPPSPTSPTYLASLTSLPLRSRNRSPYSRSHLRSRSSASSLTAPPMTRAHSSPTVDAFGHVHISNSSTTTRPLSPLLNPSHHHNSSNRPSSPFLNLSTNNRPSSPLLSATHARRSSPLRKPLDEGYSSFGPYLDISAPIAEHAELNLPLKSPDPDTLPLPSPITTHGTFPRSTRRRPSSPLYHMQSSPSSAHPTTKLLHTSISSPALATKFNEAYPAPYSIASSSMPSTPTSLRSRSPSISSLETIPDSPDAEREAVEEYENLMAAEEGGEKKEEGRGGGMVLATNAFGVVWSARDKRKRWSVCGAERRGDLDLETIWED